MGLAPVNADRAIYYGEQRSDVALGGGGGGGGGAPTDAAYIVVSLNGTLTNERTLAVGAPLTLVDGGAGNSVTLDLDETAALGNNARAGVAKNGTLVGTRRAINLIEGTNTTLTVADDAANERVNVTITSAGGGSGTVSSVGLSMPGGFTVSGTPVTTTGVLAVTTTLNGVILGTGSGFTVATAGVHYAAASHTHPWSQITGTPTTLAGYGITDAVPSSRTLTAGTGLSGGGDLSANRTFAVLYGTSGTTACVGNDPRLSDARTPLSHTHAASDIVSGTMATARLGSGTANATTFLRGDQTWATPAGGGSTDIVVVAASDQTESAGTFNSATQLEVELESATRYVFEYWVLFESSNLATGIELGLRDFGPFGFLAQVDFLVQIQEDQTSPPKSVMYNATHAGQASSGIDTVNTRRLALIRGIALTGTASPGPLGQVYLGFATTNPPNSVKILAGSTTRWSKLS